MSADLKTKGLTELTDLQAIEVSLVDAGANRKKRFPVTKKQEYEMHEILKAVLDTAVDEERGLPDWFEKAKLSPEGQAAVKAVLRTLSAYKDQLPKDALSKISDLCGYAEPEKEKKAAKPDEEVDDEKCEMEEKKKMKKDDIKKEDAKLEMPPEADLIFKAQAAELEALKKTNEDITKALRTERDKRELAEWTEKAKTDLEYYPGQSAQELGSMLKSLHDQSPELALKQFALLKGASDAMKTSSILKEAGQFGGESDNSGSAWDQIQKMADGLVQKSTDAKFTPEKAVTLVMERNPALYRQYLNEHPEQLGRKN